MERSKLKLAVIFLLAMLDLCLLGIVLWQNHSARSYESAAMEQAMNMTDEQKAAVQAAATQLAAMKQQKAALEAKLAAMQQGDSDALLQKRQDAQAQRDELAAERDAQLPVRNDHK